MSKSTYGRAPKMASSASYEALPNGACKMASRLKPADEPQYSFHYKDDTKICGFSGSSHHKYEIREEDVLPNIIQKASTLLN